jgi:hypothetical protein
MRQVLPLGIAASLGAAMLLCGCPNPNTYTVPRTLDPGALQVTVAPEAYGYSFKQTTPATSTTPARTTTLSGALPTLPTLGVRVGLAEGFDVGGRLPNLDSFAGDVKIQMLRGPADLAIDPGIQFSYVTSSATDSRGNAVSETAGVAYLHLPFLVGWNLSDSVTLVASPGVAYTIATGSVTFSDNNAQQAGTATGFMGRIGLGADFRTSKHFALHPEVTFMKGFNDADTLLFVVGLGLNFGAQPNYKEASGGGTTASPPASPQ